jgi:hypothetical protein
VIVCAADALDAKWRMRHIGPPVETKPGWRADRRPSDQANREGRSVMSQESRSSNQHRVREADDDKTVRMRAEEFSSHDTVPEQAGVYFAPRPVPMVSKHRTIETARVRLSPKSIRNARARNA